MPVDKTLITVVLGMAGTLTTAGIMWMVSTLVTVDKRTEVMDVKMDHLVEAVSDLGNRKVTYDQPRTNVLPSFEASLKGDK